MTSENKKGSSKKEIGMRALYHDEYGDIGDEEYVRHIYSQRGGSISFANYGAPRQVGLTFTYNYE